MVDHTQNYVTNQFFGGFVRVVLLNRKSFVPKGATIGWRGGI